MRHNQREHVLQDESGNVFKINHLANFAAERGIGQTYLSFLVNGKIEEYRGLRVISTTRLKKKKKKVDSKAHLLDLVLNA